MSTVRRKTVAKLNEKRAAFESLPPIASIDTEITEAIVPPMAWPEWNFFFNETFELTVYPKPGSSCIFQETFRSERRMLPGRLSHLSWKWGLRQASGSRRRLAMGRCQSWWKSETPWTGWCSQIWLHKFSGICWKIISKFLKWLCKSKSKEGGMGCADMVSWFPFTLFSVERSRMQDNWIGANIIIN